MTVYRDKRKKWWRYDFTMMGRRFTKAGFPTMQAALNAQEAHKRELRGRGLNPYATFGELVKDYLAASARTNSPAWVYQQGLKLNDRWGHLATLAPSEIKRGHIEVVLNQMGTKHKAATVNEALKIVKAVFRYAVDMEALERNPCATIRRMPDDAERKVIETPHLKKLILAARPDLKALLVLVAQTGCRVEEALALRTDTDVLHIEGPEPFCLLSTRKGGGGLRVRPQPLSQLALRAIKSQIKAGRVWVFAGPRGKLKYGTARKALVALCEKLDLPRYGFHAVRRWAGTTANMSGHQTKAVGDFLGHKSTQSTELYLKAARPEMWAVAAHLEAQLNEVAETFSHTDPHTNSEKANGGVE